MRITLIFIFVKIDTKCNHKVCVPCPDIHCINCFDLTQMCMSNTQRLCLRESSHCDVDMEPTPSHYHDNLAFSSPLHDHTILAHPPHDHTITAHPPHDHTITAHPPHNGFLPVSDSHMNHSRPRTTKQQFCTGILSEVFIVCVCVGGGGGGGGICMCVCVCVCAIATVSKL